MRVEIVMPQVGESVAEGTVLKWFKKVGEKIKKDEAILELSTDKADVEMPSPSAGVMAEILVGEGETVEVGKVIAYIEVDGKEVKPEPKRPPEKLAKKEIVAEPPPGREEAKKVVPMRKAERRKVLSPLVRKIAEAEGISEEEIERIEGTGIGGRVTKNDITAYVERKKKLAPAVEEEEAVHAAAPAVKYAPGMAEVVPMGRMRKAIADHMVMSVRTSPHVTSVAEADMTDIVRFREKVKDGFMKQEGINLTYTPFFLIAAVKALKRFPAVNSSVEGDNIVLKKYINIGMAVALEDGLIVPVLKGADEKSFKGLARAAEDLARRAREKKLQTVDLEGGTFTITNFGAVGGLMGTPIINQPQVAILGTGAIKKRPVVINDAIAIRSMIYLCLSWDHRVIDGALAEMFLKEIVDSLEHFDLSQVY